MCVSHVSRSLNEALPVVSRYSNHRDVECRASSVERWASSVDCLLFRASSTLEDYSITEQEARADDATFHWLCSVLTSTYIYSSFWYFSQMRWNWNVYEMFCFNFLLSQLTTQFSSKYIICISYFELV